jgi:hypothetical protein
MRSCFAVVALLAGCRDEPFERLDPPNEPVPRPAAVQPVAPPPVEIASFLAEAAHTTQPWRVTINELADQPKGERFLGYQLRTIHVLAQPQAEALVARLALATSYNDSPVGCTGDPVGIGLARGSQAIEFVEDCGHIYLTELRHAGRWTMLSSETSRFIRELRKH